jgi:5-methylcytosine-specific restriction protein B
MSTNSKLPLNQILYGSPGTGKTYNTINKALEIIFEKEDKEKEFEFKIKDEKDNDKETIKKSYKEILNITEENEKRKHLKGLFEYFKDEQRGQIEFVTFHQSYGYEEFVEGIKAETKDKDISYEIKAGIFKSLVEKSLSKGELASSNEKISEKNVIWKMSLGDSQSGEDKEYFDEAIKTNCLIMGYGGDEDFTSFLKKENFQDKNIDKTTIDMLDRFKNQMKKGDIVIISDGNRKFKAIAIVEGDYFYDTESIYKQKRKIKWLQRFTISRDVKEISEKNFTQVTLNKPQWINLDKLNSLISNDKQADNTNKNYVLIIDEINRGNISKIFGELITLIEPSKRISAEEEIKVKLPYSGDDFGVPQNLYIIGTMNTADRSIAPIDTALRRRFVFEEMAPKASLLTKEKTSNIYTDVDLKQLLEAINTRIEYLYDRDHTIGHAYLIDVQDLSDLIFAFKNKIIPLLAEYFYEDWENIDLVLNNNGFIESKKDDDKYLSTKIEDKIRNKITYKVSDDSTWTKEHFINIYNKNENE